MSISALCLYWCRSTFKHQSHSSPVTCGVTALCARKYFIVVVVSVVVVVVAVVVVEVVAAAVVVVVVSMTETLKRYLMFQEHVTLPCVLFEMSEVTSRRNSSLCYQDSRHCYRVWSCTSLKTHSH